jgi:hypothetical protein
LRGLLSKAKAVLFSLRIRSLAVQNGQSFMYSFLWCVGGQ